jgi:predicted MFS family arabinose efflux permease
MKKSLILYKEHLKDIGSNGWNYLLGNLLSGFGFAAFSLLFNLFLRANGVREGSIGHLLSVGTYTTVFLILPAAFIVKRVPISKIILISPIITVIGYFIAIQSNSFSMRMLGFIIAGGAGAFNSVIGGPFIMRISNEKNRTFLFSLNHATMLLAGITGNLLAGFLPKFLMNYGITQKDGFRYAIFLHLFVALLSSIFYGRLSTVRLNSEEKENRLSVRTSKRLLLYLVLPPMTVGLGAGMTIPFLNLYFKTMFNLESQIIGIIFASAQALTVMGAMLGPILAKRFGLIKTVIITQVISIPFLYILGFTYFLPAVLTAFLIRNALMNMSAPLSTNFAMEIVSPDDRPLTSGLLSVAWLATWGLTANIGGVLIEKSGYQIPFACTIFFYIVSSFLYWKLLRPIEKRRLVKNGI